MKSSFTTLLLITAIIILSSLSHSCANTKTPPSGGLKDTLPPKLIKIEPENMTLHFPRIGGKVALTFDEYTIVKDANSIYVSPPTKKMLKNKPKGKSLVFSFQDTLAENTTYTIDFGTALVDNNESNPFPRFVYTFSTGDAIDSLYFTGRVVDCQKLTPFNNALIALYTDQSDSACIKNIPVAATRTDEWGFFSLRNIKDTLYRVYAFSDEDQNSKYNPATESIAFLDSLYRPTKIVNDSIYELQGFDMKDTLKCLNRKADIELNIFKEYFSTQFIKNSGRKSAKRGFITFAAPNAEVHSFTILGVDSTDIITRYTPARDSMDFWINAKHPLEDSLLIDIAYMKSDSLGNLILQNEQIAIAQSKEERAKAKSEAGIEKIKADTLINLNLTLTPETVEQNGAKFVFEDPIIQYCLDSISLYSINTKNIEEKIDFNFEQDSMDLRIYTLQSKEPYQIGFKYRLDIKQKAFYDIYGRFNLQSQKDFQLPNIDKCSSITLNITGTNNERYIVELVDKSCSKVFRTYIINSDQKLLFPYLNAADYSFRITHDRNGNGIFDTGNMLKGIQPERVILLKLADGNSVITVIEQTDIEQDLKL